MTKGYEQRKESIARRNREIRRAKQVVAEWMYTEHPEIRSEIKEAIAKLAGVPMPDGVKGADKRRDS